MYPSYQWRVPGGGGTRDACPALLVEILSFSCSFRQNFCQIIGWRPLLALAPLWEILNSTLLTVSLSKIHDVLVPFVRISRDVNVDNVVHWRVFPRTGSDDGAGTVLQVPGGVGRGARPDHGGVHEERPAPVRVREPDRALRAARGRDPRGGRALRRGAHRALHRYVFLYSRNFLPFTLSVSVIAATSLAISIQLNYLRFPNTPRELVTPKIGYNSNCSNMMKVLMLMFQLNHWHLV